MFQRLPSLWRPAATVVECAIVYPGVFLLLLGLIVGGLGVFRYQQVAHLAHEAARHASVRGGQYQAETGQASPDQQAIRDYVISQSAALEAAPQALTVEVFLNVTGVDASGNPSVTAVAWDQSNKAPYNLIADNGQARQNTISVTVRYQWMP